MTERLPIAFRLQSTSSFAPDPPLVGISELLAKVAKPYSRMRPAVINANVSISRPGCTRRDANMLYEGVYENVRRRRQKVEKEEGRKEGRKKSRSRGSLPRLRILPRCTGDAPSGAHLRVCMCLCRRQILPHNFGIFHCGAGHGRERIASRTIVIRSWERTKGNERRTESPRRVSALHRARRRYSACEGHTREPSAARHE